MLTKREESMIKNRKSVYFILGLFFAGYVLLAILLIFELIETPHSREEALKYLILIGLLNSTVMIYYIVRLYDTVIKLSNK